MSNVKAFTLDVYVICLFVNIISAITREYLCNMLMCSRRKEAKRRKRHERPRPLPGTPVNEYVEVKETQQRKALRLQEGI